MLGRVRLGVIGDVGWGWMWGDWAGEGGDKKRWGGKIGKVRGCMWGGKRRMEKAREMTQHPGLPRTQCDV